MNEDQKFFEWLDKLCEDADADLALLNMLERRSSAFGHYYANVYKLKSVPQSGYGHYYGQHHESLRRLFAEYEQTARTQEAVAKVEGLEAKLDKLQSMLEALVEAQTPKQQKQIAEATAQADAPAEDAPAETTPEEPAHESAAEAEAEPAESE